MDAVRFDRRVRALLTPASRRGTVGGLLAGLLSSVVPATGPEAARRRAKKKRQHRRDHDARGEDKKRTKKTCPPCKKRKQGKCNKKLPDGTACASGTCLSGRCSPTDQTCMPNCAGKVCGENGCGGSCGTCPDGETCSANGLCNCLADCAVKSCGDDGCGGFCGNCDGGFTCQDGTCTCVPDCTGKQCGGDRCGGSCGTCPNDLICEGGQCVPAGGDCRRPFPQHVPYAAGTILPNHRSQSQRDDDVRAAYDSWKKRYLVAVNGQYRVAMGNSGSARDSTVSEGQGFGMAITAVMAGYDPEAQTIFNGLWNFALTHPSCNDSRLMLWRIPNGGFGCSSATDGDLDIAYGLLLADAQWGSEGAVNYRVAANQVLAGILASNIGPQSNLPLLGDWVNPDGPKYNQWTPRSSDFMTAYYRAFGRATGDTVWQNVAEAALDVVESLQAEYSPTTGLLPDFVEPVSHVDHDPRPASPGFLEGPNDGAYNYNAGRDPWRLGTDGLLNADARALGAVAKISTWIETNTNGDPLNIRAGYQLNGAPIGSYFTTFFAAPFGVAAMAVPSQQAWLNAIYDAVYNRVENYYEDSVALLCLLVMTANFWDPTT